MEHHIIPKDDSMEHDPSANCSCDPDVEYTEEGVVYTHILFDGRECLIDLIEMGMNSFN